MRSTTTVLALVALLLASAAAQAARVVHVTFDAINFEDNFRGDASPVDHVYGTLSFTIPDVLPIFVGAGGGGLLVQADSASITRGDAHFDEHEIAVRLSIDEIAGFDFSGRHIIPGEPVDKLTILGSKEEFDLQDPTTRLGVIGFEFSDQLQRDPAYNPTVVVFTEISEADLMNPPAGGDLGFFVARADSVQYSLTVVPVPPLMLPFVLCAVLLLPRRAG